MSIFGALNSSVTGLQAQSDALGVISDNISNVNTTGYKANKANFAQLVTSAPTETSFNPGGVQFRPSQEIGQQGILNSSEITTDMAVDGNGFFAVKDAAGEVEANQLKYTRTGNFRVNDEGNLQNQNGFLLQGWQLTRDANGDLTAPPDQTSPDSLQTVNVKGFSGIARATENVNLGANLPPNLDPGESRSVTSRIFDAEGTGHNLKFNFSRNDGQGNELAEDKYRVEINAPTRSDDDSGVHSALFENGTVDLTNLNRTNEDSVATVLNEIKQEAANNPNNGGANGSTIQFDLDGVSMELEDTSGSDFGGASTAPDTISNVALSDINSVEDQLELRVTSGPGATVNDQASGETFDDITLDNLVQSTFVPNVANDNAVTLENSPASAATVNLLGTSVQARLNADDGVNLQDQTGGADLANGANGLSLTSEVDSLRVNRDTNATTGDTNDLVLKGTNSGTTFNQTSRLATIVEFEDGAIQTIGNPNTDSGNVAADTPFLQGDENGELNVRLNFQPGPAIPDGTSVTEPQEVTLNVGTPRNVDLNQNGQIDSSEENVNEKQLDGLTSFENPEGFQINELEQDGLQFGNFTGVDVDQEGIVTANFSNGERREIFQIPVATFNNPNGLKQNSGTVFEESRDSGEVLLNEAGVGGAGSVAPGALEDSTVELSTEFTNMIETQRAYSASTRVVTTSDEMLQEITNATR